MQVSIDRAGRIVVPKPLRDALALAPDTRLEIELVDGHLELSPSREPARVVDGPNGPLVAGTGTVIGGDDVRRALEAVRDRR